MNTVVFTKRFLLATVVLTICACAPKRKPVAAAAPVVVEPPKIIAPKIEADLGNLVPFTRDIYFKLRESGLDIKSLKFYVEQPVVLNKVSGAGTMVIKNGVLVNDQGANENTINIPTNIAGSVDVIEPDGLRINFGRPGSNIKFIANNTQTKCFYLTGDKPDKTNGTVELPYNNAIYLAKCGGCKSVSDIKLLIKQLDILPNNNNGSSEPGTQKF